MKKAARPNLKDAMLEIDDLTNEVSSLLGVANIDVADDYGDANAEPREIFLVPSPQGGDVPTPYARRFARKLVERMLYDYDIVPRPPEDDEPQSPITLKYVPADTATLEHRVKPKSQGEDWDEVLDV